MSALPIVNPADYLPAPNAIAPLDYETLFAAWKGKFKELWPAYDVDSLETDPGVIIAEAYAYLRLVDRANVNDVYRALRLPYARKADLDGLAADRGVKRLTYVPATATTDAVMEGDVSLLLRTWLKMQTWGSGTPYGVEYHARTLGMQYLADAHVIDYPGDGRMTCVILPMQGLAADTEQLLRSTVGNGLMERWRRPGAVSIETVQADIITVPYTGVLKIARGASPSTVLATAQDGLTKYMLSRRQIGALVPVSAMEAEQFGFGVVAAEASAPVADVIVPETAAAELGTVDITVQVVNG